MVFSKICSALFRQPLITRILSRHPLVGDGQTLTKLPPAPVVSSTWFKNYSTSKKPTSQYATPSPYKTPRPKRYGYDTEFFTGGVLPRLENDYQLKSRPAYKVKNAWSREKALFGQNDYIDILGDGSIHPKELIRGPAWLVGFRGNEMNRLTRRLRFEGPKLRYLYPTKYHKIKKRIKWLYRFYNIRRHKSSY